MNGACVPKALTLIALFGGLSAAAASDAPLDSRAQRAAAVLSESTNEAVTVYEIRFGLRLSNRSEKTVSIPTLPVGMTGATTGFVLSVQSQQADGRWKYLNQASFYGTEATRYADCSPLAPGATAGINDLVHVLPLLRARAQELGTEPILRLGVMVFCRKPDGTVLNLTTTTEPFQLHLPTIDK
jgi:hypothetical protein